MWVVRFPLLHEDHWGMQVYIPGSFFCVEIPCSPCVCVGSLWVLSRFLPLPKNIT